jgi:hypothetical protein
LNPQEPTFDVRPAEPEDYDTLVKIFNEVFHKDKDRNTLEWKYLRNPHGRSHVWVATDPQGEIVGSLAFVPRKMVIQGGEYITLLASDGMVFKEWQRRGIFVRLLNIMFEKSWAMEAPLAIAFSGRRSVKGLIRTDWDEVGLVQELVLPLRGTFLFKAIIRRLAFLRGPAGALGDLLLRQGRLKGFLKRTMTSEVKAVERFDDALARAGMEALALREVYLVKDRDWLNWRFVDNPTKRHRSFGAYRNGKAAGYMVMETGNNRSYIVELLASDEEVRRDLLAQAVREGHSQGGEMLQSMALEGDGIDRFLLASGFNCLPRYGLLPFMIKMGPAGASLKRVVTDSRLWYLAHGDKDAEHMTV